MRKLHLGILIATLLLLGGGLLGYSFVKSGYFPIARVNGDIITMRSVEENINVSRQLYSAGLVTDSDIENLFKEGEDKIFKNVFESLIINIVVKNSIPEETQRQADQRIEDYLKDVNIANLSYSIKTLYDWDMKKFRQKILEPQALDEVLAEEYGDRYEQWLNDVKMKAEVSIWFLPYKWERGELKGK